MIYEYAYLDVAPGREKEFEQAVLAGRPILASADGCTSVDLYPDVETPGSYLLRIGWETLEKHLVDFPASKQAPEWAAAIEHFIVGQPVLRHFDATALA
ncbi:antibiotic biosynthesis monooxygenase [Streptomyces sp. SCA3-4]|uniref:antibiotic biosynthesis monooxygenase family protein n=1 Tax=Streptomyces sichuanensis TaxID=2871810 RepID=UPI001CE388E1|nr:antibiotic biosynthesis monooxygenase family protein [Streptomyces sichuanensis]MCA6093132.1 antibiotic biosynthesis monooxygenase [Streptomyces sichuanensis]